MPKWLEIKLKQFSFTERRVDWKKHLIAQLFQSRVTEQETNAEIGWTMMMLMLQWRPKKIGSAWNQQVTSADSKKRERKLWMNETKGASSSRLRQHGPFSFLSLSHSLPLSLSLPNSFSLSTNYFTPRSAGLWEACMPRSSWEREGERRRERACATREWERKKANAKVCCHAWLVWLAPDQMESWLGEKTTYCWDWAMFWPVGSLLASKKFKKNTHKGEFWRKSKIGDAWMNIFSTAVIKY